METDKCFKQYEIYRNTQLRCIKLWQQRNHDKLLQNLKNRPRIICECGCEIYRFHRIKHEATNKHKRLLLTNNQNTINETDVNQVN